MEGIGLKVENPGQKPDRQSRDKSRSKESNRIININR